MSAVGLSSPFFTISSALCTCLGTGLIALSSNSLGSGGKNTLNKYFNSAVTTMLAVSIVLMIIFLVFTSPIAMLFGARGDGIDLLEGTTLYMRGLAIGLPSFLVSGVVSQVIQLDGNGRYVRLSAIGCLISDAVFDFLAVSLGFGLFGIGLATSLSSVVKLVLLSLPFFKRKTNSITLKLVLPRFSDIWEMIKSGSDTLVLSAVNVIRPIFLNSLIITAGGSAAMAVLSVYNNLNGFVSFICTGIASALSITIGTFYGEVNKRDIRRVCSFAQKMVLALYIPVIVIILAFSKQISHYYLPDFTDLNLMMFALVCLSVNLIAYSMLYLRVRYLQTIHRQRTARLLTFLSNFVIIMACAYIASLLADSHGIIAANVLSSIICLVIIVILTQIRSRKFLLKDDDYMYLPKQFDHFNGPETSLAVHDPLELNDAILTLTDFFKTPSVVPACAEKIAQLLFDAVRNGNEGKIIIDISVEIGDDGIYSKFLEVMVREGEKDLNSITACGLQKIKPGDKLDAPDRFPTQEIDLNYLYSIKGKLLSPFSACGKLFPKNMFIRIRFPAGLYNEDMYASPVLMHEADRIVFIHANLYYYYMLENSYIHMNWQPKKLEELYAAEFVARYLKNCGCEDAHLGLLYRIQWIIKRQRGEMRRSDEKHKFHFYLYFFGKELEIKRRIRHAIKGI